MLLKHQSRRCCSLWKKLLLLVSTHSPSRSSSSSSFLVVAETRAAFSYNKNSLKYCDNYSQKKNYNNYHRSNINVKRRTIMTLFPESPSIIEKCSTPITGRRGRTNTGTSEIASIGTQPRRSVRLFQGRSSDNSDADEFVLPLTPTTKKQTVTRTSRKNNKRTAS